MKNGQDQNSIGTDCEKDAMGRSAAKSEVHLPQVKGEVFGFARRGMLVGRVGQ